jgi:hypothetical protein
MKTKKVKSEKVNMKKLNMKLTLEVVGKEGLTVTVDYKDTSLDTVKLVENALAQAIMSVNK